MLQKSSLKSKLAKLLRELNKNLIDWYYTASFVRYGELKKYL